MTARSPGAFMLSATFHALIVGLIVLWGMVGTREKPQPKVLELVAGEGDNYGATEAPKLGTPTGVKVDIPTPPPKTIDIPPAPEPEPEPVTPPPQPQPEPKPTPKAPPKTEPPPVIKDSPNATPPKQPEKKQLTPKQVLLRKVWAAQHKGKEQAAKERAAEEKRLKEQQKVAAAKAAASGKVAHIDAKGIKEGVLEGTGMERGAGGKALVASGDVIDRYFALLKQRVLNALDKPPGLMEDYAVEVEFHLAPNGRISNVRVLKSSGSQEWDRAAVAAFSRVTMPEHPEKKHEDLQLTIKTKDVGER